MSIYRSTSLSLTLVSNRLMFLTALALISIELCIDMLWTTVNPSHAHEVMNEDGIRSYTTCRSVNNDTMWLALSVSSMSLRV